MATFFSLFGSMSTLLCCALPVTLVSIGMGATFASLTATFPQVIWLTERKEALFILTGIMLALSYYFMKKSEAIPCPTDLKQRDVCQTTKPKTTFLFWLSLCLYGVGLSFSYVIPIFL